MWGTSSLSYKCVQGSYAGLHISKNISIIRRLTLHRGKFAPQFPYVFTWYYICHPALWTLLAHNIVMHRLPLSPSRFDQLSWQQYSHRDSLPDDGIMPNCIDANWYDSSNVTYEAMSLKMAICNLTSETTPETLASPVNHSSLKLMPSLSREISTWIH